MILMAMFSPLALNAQDLADYTYTTGVDASRWITLDDPQTAMSSGHDDDASSLLPMGTDFSFHFGNGTYTQFWVNSNGMFSFSTEPLGIDRFWSDSRFPKICGISADLKTGDEGYINYQLTGTAPNRVFVCEFVMDPNQLQSSYSDVKWQIQLHEADSKVVIIYGTAPYTNPRYYQIGIGQSANDIWLMDPQSHAATHYTSIPEGRSTGWHGGYRYYEFNPPVCFDSTTGLAVVENSLTTRGVTMQWDAEVGDVFDYAIELGANIDPETVTYAESITATETTCSMTWDDLIPDNDYTVFIRRNCGNGAFGQPATMTIHTEIACFAPTNLTATANYKTATVAWEGDADSYEIAWSVDSNADPDQNIDPDFQISGTTGSKEFTTIDTRYYFRVRANCGDEGYSNWEGPADTYIGYCRPNCWSMNGNGITNLVYTGTNTVTNTTHPYAYPYYGYYIDQICEIKTDETATLDITYETGYGYKTYIWVDFDNSLSFEDSEILYTGESENSWSSTLNASITLPPTTAPGDYRMRIGGADDGMNNGGIPCYNNRYAVFEDYTLRVIEVTCPRPTDLTTTNLTINSTTLNWESDAESFEVQYRVPYAEWNFFEGFENGLPSNWSTIHNGPNPNDSWIPNDNSSYAHSGTGCMYSFSNDPDEWLISPQVPLHGTLKFYLRAANEEHFAVYVSTGTTSIDDFVMVGEERVVNPFQTFNEITVDLNSFNGAMGYVAIRHFNSAGLDALLLDDFSIYYYQEYGQWIETTSETNSLDLTDLPRNTGYEFQVKAHCDGNETSIWSDIATFTTPDYCSAPYYLTAEAVSNTVELGWTGYSNTYNVRYRHFTNDPYNELATVILTAGPPFYEYAGGFQMLLDANADAIGPGQFDLFTKPYEDWFEYTIPVDADKYYWTSHMVSNGSVAIQIPAGTYDWVIVNPNPRYEHVDYIGDEGNVGSRQDNYVFEAGKVYEFEVKMYGRLSGADVTITEQTSDWTLVEEVTNPCTLTDLIAGTRYQFQVQGVNCDGNGNNTEWSEVAVFTMPSFYTKHIDPYTDNGGYYLIASPIGEVSPTNVGGMLDNVYDLYYFDQTLNREWVNYKEAEGNHNPGFNLQPGQGYLYANSGNNGQGIDLVFAGSANTDFHEVTLVHDTHAEFPGINLVGNPFAVEANIADGRDFYRLAEGGAEVMADATNGTIQPMEGIFVHANDDAEVISFTTVSRGTQKRGIALNLSQDRGNVIDRAIIRFGESRQLPKFQLNRNHTKLYIPQNGKDYAVVCSEDMGTVPVNFKAESNGNYTLNFNTDDVNFNYFHLIDNMTGNDIDLLKTPNYSFEAKTTDYESRFKLVFVCGDANDDNDFAFYSNGSFVINNEGHAKLQVIDVTGRILKSESINGCASISMNAAPGIYLFRLINGNDVKVQKILVE